MSEELRIFMRYPDGKPKALTLSYDDGVEQDAPLIEKMRAHGVKGTFNLNSGLFAPAGTVYPAGQIHRRMPQADVLALYADSGMEIAVHALTHPHLEYQTRDTVLHEVLEDRRNLETLFGLPVQGMAYPFGTFNDAVVETLRLAGIVYSRTTRAHGSFRQPDDWLRLEATCHHNDPRLMQLAAQFANDTPKADPWLFYLWGHSYEFERDDNWQVMDAFLDTVSGKNDVWYATNIEVYRYTEAFKRLVFTVDRTRCYNPTDTTVWALAGEKLVKLPAGETVSV